MTKREMYAQILNHLTDSAEIDFIKHEIELLDSKNSNRKPTARQFENSKFKELILSALGGEDEKMTISELQDSIPEFTNLSNQRISAMLTQLVKAGYVSKCYEKRKAYFYIEA